jgi:L-ascorbate metabolism protein UlaG (beta-lactamase superfamily)
MKVTYLGTACVLVEYAGIRILTDPVFDPSGRTYGFGPWYAPRSWFASTRSYEVPMTIEQLGAIDLVLISHDQHADNLDAVGRQVLTTAGLVVTNPVAAKRLGSGIGLATGESTTVGAVRVTSTPARHGPPGLPQVNQVTGFLLEAEGEPSVWISGDTVLTTPLRTWLREHEGVDVAIVHAGGVQFERAPFFSRFLFTMDAAQVAEAVAIAKPGVVIPIHRSGWTHFQHETFLRAALPSAVWLDLGESYGEVTGAPSL